MSNKRDGRRSNRKGFKLITKIIFSLRDDTKTSVTGLYFIDYGSSSVQPAKSAQMHSQQRYILNIEVSEHANIKRCCICRGSSLSLAIRYSLGDTTTW